MTDVTAQGFRQAAILPGIGDLFRCLLLAAAEACEQLDVECEISEAAVHRLAALTTERDLLAKVNARVTDLLTVVTAERDAARATLANVRNYIGDGPRATHSQVGLDILALLGEAHDGAAP